MISYAGMNLTTKSFDEMYSRLARTNPKQGSVFRLYYSSLLDTNVFFSSPRSFESLKDKLQLTLLGEKEFKSLSRVK